MNKPTTISKEGRQLIEHFEGRAKKVYICPAGKATIGIGHVIQPGEMFTQPLSDEQIDALFARDIRRFEQAIHVNVAVDLTQSQFDGLVAFAFNVGTEGFRMSTLRKLLNKGLYKEACGQFARWNKATDPKTGAMVVLPGLTRRRRCEALLFSGKDIAFLEAKNWYR